MTEKKIVVDYYFDYCCPWTYLSFKRLIQTTTRTASVINWKPILLADIEQELGSMIDPIIHNSSEKDYEIKDLQDWANYCGLKITPRNNDLKNVSKKALCGVFCAIEANKIVRDEKKIKIRSAPVFCKSCVPKINKMIFIIINTPDLTTATACSKALTGVGATIAAGNHL